MNNYERTIQLVVSVQAYDEDDVADVLNDYFGPGEESSDIVIKEMNIVTE